MILQPFFLRMFGNPITRQIKSTATVGTTISVTFEVTATKIWIQRIYNGVSIVTSYEYLVDTVITLDIDADTSLGVFGSIEQLDCGANQLTELDLSVNTALTFLYCNFNQLTELDLSANTALTILYCSQNQLTELDLSANTALTELDCSQNQLTELDLSASTALTELDCNFNQLTELDLSANTELTSVTVSGNPFMSDGTEALNFANSLPTTTGADLYLSSADSETTTVDPLAQAKGWNVVIS